MEDSRKLEARSESRCPNHGVVGATGTVIYRASGGEATASKKKKNDERSQYIIENKGSGLQTNPNEATGARACGWLPTTP
jgi:hypothetical protein